MNIPTYHVRREPDHMYLDAGPCPYCAATDAGMDTTAPGRPGALWVVTCHHCRGQWEARIEDAP